MAEAAIVKIICLQNIPKNDMGNALSYGAHRDHLCTRKTQQTERSPKITRLTLCATVPAVAISLPARRSRLSKMTRCLLTSSSPRMSWLPT